MNLNITGQYINPLSKTYTYSFVRDVIVSLKRTVKKCFLGPNDTAFPQSDQHPTKGCKLYQHYLPCQRLPPCRSFLSCRSSFPCVQQRNHLDSFAGYMEGQIIGIDFGSVGAPL